MFENLKYNFTRGSLFKKVLIVLSLLVVLSFCCLLGLILYHNAEVLFVILIALVIVAPTIFIIDIMERKHR